MSENPILTRDHLEDYGFEIGPRTYGTPSLYWWGEDVTLKIGDFTSISKGVQIILGGNHRKDWVTTYPFPALAAWPEAKKIAGHPSSSGDITIGNDVWIGADVTILSGATIGNGAVIGAGSVVRRDIPAYCIAIGNPARVVGRRFSEDVSKQLELVGWWNWPDHKIKSALPLLLSNDVSSILAYGYPPKPEEDRTPRSKVYDCIMYNGEENVLAIRLHELSPSIDVFVVVEACVTFSGLPRRQRLDLNNPLLAPFANRIRHVMLLDPPPTDDPWERERWQRNGIMRGLADAVPDDLIIMSDADEIPRLSTVNYMLSCKETSVFSLTLRMYYFYLNYCNVDGPVVPTPINAAVRRSVLDSRRPDELRAGLRAGSIEGKLIRNAGWHFSYLMDHEGIRKKITEFSHQEYNTDDFLANIDVTRLVQEGKDLFGDVRNVWRIVDICELPDFVQANKDTFTDFILRPDLKSISVEPL